MVRAKAALGAPHSQVPVCCRRITWYSQSLFEAHPLVLHHLSFPETPCVYVPHLPTKLN